MTMTPTTIALYGIPCDACGTPAHHVEIYPNGRRIVHVDRRKGACNQTTHTTSKP